LIKRRSKLKGIANRKKHNEVENKIKDVSRRLKESTKKLCRLFKENTNLDDDSRKVRLERNHLLTTLGDYMEAL
jgi:AraC-like DNA-binding protein